MKCPSCHQSLGTFLEFYLWSHPFNRTCKNCGTKLKPNNKIKQFLLIETVTVFMVIYLVNESYALVSMKGLSLAFVSCAIICLPFERFAWSKGYYTIK